MKKFAAYLLTMVMLSSAIVGCGSYETSDSSEVGGESSNIETLTFAVGMDADTLDAQKINISRSGEIAYYIYANLLKSYNGKIEYDIAESHEISEDGLVYTFNLREAFWQDGEKVTAEDFRYAVERILDPATASTQAEDYYFIKNAEAFNKGEITDPSLLGVKAIDENTYEMTLEYEHPYLLTFLSVDTPTYPVRKDVVDQYGSNYGSSVDTVLCNGPYTLTKWAAESEIVMTKNENYWNSENITVNELIRLTVADANTRMGMFDSGDIDCTNETVADMAGNYPGAEDSISGTIRSLQINVEGRTAETKDLMSNRNFINALSYSIDRVAFTNAVDGKFTQPINRFGFSSFEGANGGSYNDENTLTNLVPLEGNKDKAIEYFESALEELGLTRETMPTVTVVCFDNNFRTKAEAYIDTWAQVLGVTSIELTVYPIPVAIQNCQSRNYDIYLQSYSVGIDPYDYLAAWVSDGGVNWTGWSDPVYDKMISDSKYITNQEERYELLADAEQYLLENGPQIPINNPGSYYLINDEIQGYYNGDGGSDKQQFQHCTYVN